MGLGWPWYVAFGINLGPQKLASHDFGVEINLLVPVGFR